MAELEKVFEKAWDGYHVYRKWPRVVSTRVRVQRIRATALPPEWLESPCSESSQAETTAEGSGVAVRASSSSTARRAASTRVPARSRRRGGSRSVRASSSRRCRITRSTFSTCRRCADEPWKVIHPCKALRVDGACRSATGRARCYPNHALGQTNDWMAEIYPRWVAAHGVFILCPVHWYQAPAQPEADDRSPGVRRRRQSRSDDRRTARTAALAKAIELEGLGLSQASRRPRVRGRRARRRRRAGDAAGVCSPTGSPTSGMIQAGPSARARRVDRLLPAVRHQPRRISTTDPNTFDERQRTPRCRWWRWCGRFERSVVARQTQELEPPVEAGIADARGSTPHHMSVSHGRGETPWRSFVAG